ncbi:hypothetical protein ILYODFUR_004336 [Ilyodon furcidens]|uniref:Uncharacterized protein n=1 Tax=Ilyodon furcidens TaxID=33524 RepID=A0ABV0U6H6_9TELE
MYWISLARMRKCSPETEAVKKMDRFLQVRRWLLHQAEECNYLGLFFMSDSRMEPDMDWDLSLAKHVAPVCQHKERAESKCKALALMVCLLYISYLRQCDLDCD